MLQTPSRLGEYLRARRSVIQPEDADLPRDPARRVNGLRREEVARLAGISSEYYLRLEQGRARQPSRQVLDSLVSALRLDGDAAVFLHRVAREDDLPYTAPGPCAPDAVAVDFVEQLRDVGALLVDMNLDVLHSNSLARALMPGIADGGANLILELHRSVGRPVVERDRVIAYLCSVLRFISDPRDPRLHEVVGDLSLHESGFPAVWARYDVRQPVSFTARIELEVLGTVDLRCQMLFFPSGRHAVLTLSGSDDAGGRAAMRYLQVLGDETAVASSAGA